MPTGLEQCERVVNLGAGAQELAVHPIGESKGIGGVALLGDPRAARGHPHPVGRCGARCGARARPPQHADERDGAPRVEHVKDPGHHVTGGGQRDIRSMMDGRGMGDILGRDSQDRILERLGVGEHPACAGPTQPGRDRSLEHERVGELGHEVARVLPEVRTVPLREPERRGRDRKLPSSQAVPERSEGLHEEEISRTGVADRHGFELGGTRGEYLRRAEGVPAAEELRASVDREDVPARERRTLQCQRLVLERHIARRHGLHLAGRQMSGVPSDAPPGTSGDEYCQDGRDDAVRTSRRGGRHGSLPWRGRGTWPLIPRLGAIAFLATAVPARSSRGWPARRVARRSSGRRSDSRCGNMPRFARNSDAEGVSAGRRGGSRSGATSSRRRASP